MTKILVTGGAGYIGSHVNKELTRQNYETLVLDNLVYGHCELVKWGEFILADLANKEQLRLIFQKFDIQAVIHFAAFAYVGESIVEPRYYYQNNLVNTLNLIEAMLDFGVKYIIFSSSCATYGVPYEIPITENHLQNPINPYGRSKLMIENILEDYAYAYDLHYVSLRYFNAAGADANSEIGEWHNPETHLIPLVLDTACGHKDHVQIYGTDYDTPDGTCIRDFIHVTDLAHAHILALQYLQNNGDCRTFNLGNGKGFSVKELIKCVGKVTGKDISYKEIARRPGDPPCLVGSAHKAQTVLGWEPKYKDLEEIVESAWRWHKKIKN